MVRWNGYGVHWPTSTNNLSLRNNRKILCREFTMIDTLDVFQSKSLAVTYHIDEWGSCNSRSVADHTGKFDVAISWAFHCYFRFLMFIKKYRTITIAVTVRYTFSIFHYLSIREVFTTSRFFSLQPAILYTIRHWNRNYQ